MAHGVTPPFSGHLIARDFISKCSCDQEISGDITLLGNANNEVLVVQEVAEMLQTTLKKIRFYLVASGYPDIMDEGKTCDLSTNRLVTLLLAAAFQIDDAVDVLAIILPKLKDASASQWRTMISGILNYRIQYIEDAVGEVMREGAKDVCLYASYDAGVEKFEEILSAA